MSTLYFENSENSIEMTSKCLIALFMMTFSPLVLTKKADRESAPYTTIKETQNYEVRSYDQMKWVCHSETKKNFIPGFNETQFFSLFKYISGENEKKQKIPMTSPVTMKYTPREESQMCFYLPSNVQNSPPRSKDSEIFIYEAPSMTVYVRTFGGFVRLSSSPTWNSEAQLLRADLEAANEADVNYDNFISAGYDSPMKKNNRRNEVWYLKN